jgi:hypothetical protein
MSERERRDSDREAKSGVTPSAASPSAPRSGSVAPERLGGGPAGAETKPSLLAMTDCATCHVSTPIARFCTACGASLVARRYCSECGARLTPHTHFCEACGAKVA